MGTVNSGGQTISWDFKHPANGDDFNRLLRNILQPGIYKGGALTHAGSNVVSIAPFDAMYKASTDKLVHVKTSSAVTVTPTVAEPVIYTTFVWLDVVENWADFDIRAEGTPATNEICLGKALFDGSGNITGFDYGCADKVSGYNLDLLRFDVYGNAYVSGDVSISGDLDISNDVTIGGNTDINGTLNVDNSITFTDTTQSTDKDTGSVILEGGIGIEKNINAGGTIKNTDTTQSTDKDTGAIVTEGGIGIEKNANIGGNLSVAGAGVIEDDFVVSGDLTLADAKDLKVQGTGRIEHDGTNVSGYSTDGSVLRTKIIEIGDWNMDSTSDVAIAHGIADFTKIRGILTIIRDDTNANYYDFPNYNVNDSDQENARATSSSIVLRRGTSGIFDNTSFDSTSYNRGWIIIQYID